MGKWEAKLTGKIMRKTENVAKDETDLENAARKFEERWTALMNDQKASGKLPGLAKKSRKVSKSWGKGSMMRAQHFEF